MSFSNYSGSRAMNKKYLFLNSILVLQCSRQPFLFQWNGKELILFFAILSIFDSFSRLPVSCGDEEKYFKDSPNKTVEGFIGGTLIAIFSGFLIKGLIDVPPIKAIIWQLELHFSHSLVIFSLIL
jgi:predicted CDP-diglyceride synthetase/phosphatidate cytidylyltransferase